METTWRPETGERRVIDPSRDRFTVQEKAALIGRERFGAVRPANLSAEKFTEDARGQGDDVRKALARLFDRLEGKLTPEQLQLRELVGKQYAGELALLKANNLYDAANSNEGDIPPPDAEEASELLLTQLSPEQVEAIMKTAKRPQFQLEALTTFARYAAALDAHRKMPGQIDTYVNPNLAKKLAAQDVAAGIKDDKVAGWKVGIIDAAQEIDADPKLVGNLGQKRNAAQAQLKTKGLRMPHPRRYALAQMRAIQQEGKPLDEINWSMLDDTGDNAVVPGGFWDRDQVYFNEYNPGYQNDRARVRPEVVVKA